MRILVIPDSQVKPHVDLHYLSCIGRLIVAEKPDRILHLGDFADMESLSSYDKGKRSYEGRRYKADIDASHRGMQALLGPLRDYNQRRADTKHAQYRPKMDILYGNHEHRINRTINDEPLLDGTIGLDDLGYASYGWTVHKFLDVITIEGIAFSHYFTTGAMGRPASTAQAMLNKKHMSCIAGHQQGRQMAQAYRADGRRITAIIAGSCYTHEEDYLGPQGNKHWHGVLMLNNVDDGQFDEHFIPLSDILRDYA